MCTVLGYPSLKCTAVADPLSNATRGVYYQGTFRNDNFTKFATLIAQGELCFTVRSEACNVVIRSSWDVTKALNKAVSVQTTQP